MNSSTRQTKRIFEQLSLPINYNPARYLRDAYVLISQIVVMPRETWPLYRAISRASDLPADPSNRIEVDALLALLKRSEADLLSVQSQIARRVNKLKQIPSLIIDLDQSSVTELISLLESKSSSLKVLVVLDGNVEISEKIEEALCNLDQLDEIYFQSPEAFLSLRFCLRAGNCRMTSIDRITNDTPRFFFESLQTAVDASKSIQVLHLNNYSPSCSLLFSQISWILERFYKHQTFRVSPSTVFIILISQFVTINSRSHQGTEQGVSLGVYTNPYDIVYSRNISVRHPDPSVEDLNYLADALLTLGSEFSLNVDLLRLNASPELIDAFARIVGDFRDRLRLVSFDNASFQVPFLSIFIVSYSWNRPLPSGMHSEAQDKSHP